MLSMSLFKKISYVSDYLQLFYQLSPLKNCVIRQFYFQFFKESPHCYP